MYMHMYVCICVYEKLILKIGNYYKLKEGRVIGVSCITLAFTEKKLGIEVYAILPTRKF